MPEIFAAQQNFRRTLIVLVAVGFAALCAVVLTASVLMGTNQRQMGWVDHTYRVERQIDLIRLSTTRIQAVRWRGGLLATPETRAAGADARARLASAIDRFGALTRDSPRHQARLPLLHAAAQWVSERDDMPPFYAPGADPDRTGPQNDPHATLANLRARIDHSARSSPAARTIVQLCMTMEREEDRLLAVRTARLHATLAAFYAILGIAGVLLVVVGALLVTTLRGYTRDINLSRHALRAANTGLEAAVAERTMELSRANGEIQRFAYIVSHDLRSPLVNVLGFTAELEAGVATLRELLLEGPAPPEGVPDEVRTVIADDLPEAIHFIRSSTQKMDRLINAILGLSRLGRRALNPEWVDLRTLVTGVVDAMRTTIDRAEGRVEIAPDLPAVHCDRLALEQMIGNLIENAIKYAGPGRPPVVTVSAARQGQRVVISVADNGRGIEPRDHERIFDLFRRSGPQDRPGEGIGLAHVRALAYRLNGSVRVESRPGEGSTFSISLPITFADNQDQVP